MATQLIMGVILPFFPLSSTLIMGSPADKVYSVRRRDGKPHPSMGFCLKIISTILRPSERLSISARYVLLPETGPTPNLGRYFLPYVVLGLRCFLIAFLGIFT